MKAKAVCLHIALISVLNLTIHSLSLSRENYGFIEEENVCKQKVLAFAESCLQPVDGKYQIIVHYL